MGQRALALAAIHLGGLVIGLPSGAKADSASPQPSIGEDALPGLIRADSAEAIPKGLLVALTSGYGYTGTVLDQDDSHHRGASRVALSYRLVPGLAAALRFDGRYDRHFGSAGKDDGWVGDPRLVMRYQRELGRGLGAGLQLGLWAPGSEAPSLKASAVSVESSAAISYRLPEQKVLLAANLGYRLDRSAASVEGEENLSLADRMSLGVSEYNAVLLAVGVGYRVGSANIAAEWSLDLLHGENAPGFRQSPMRVGAAAQVPLDERFAVVASTEIRLSQVALAQVSDKLLPFDPRFQVTLGLQLRFGKEKSAPRPVLVVEPPIEPEKDPIVVALFRGRVLSGEQGVANAVVEVEQTSGEVLKLQTDAEGAFSAELPPGELSVSITADGFESKGETFVLEQEPAELLVYLDPLLPPGQLRGVVRSFRGRPLKAELRIEPELRVVETADDGSFELDLPPGDYAVTITVPRYRSQTREIRIDQDGVTIMNVDLRK